MVPSVPVLVECLHGGNLLLELVDLPPLRPLPEIRFVILRN